MKGKSIRWYLAMMAVLCLIVTSLGTPVQGANPKEVKIGVLYPMTGGAAQAGWDNKQVLELALEIINTTKHKDLGIPLADTEGLPNFGGAKVSMVISDHQGKPDVGLGEADRLITQEKVAVLFGAYHSSVTLTSSQVAERKRFPYYNAESSSPKLTKRGFKWFFRTSPHDETFSAAMFDCLKDMEKAGAKIKTVAILHEDTLYGKDSGRIEKGLAKKAGYKVKALIPYRRSATTLTSEVQRLKAANPDVFFPTSYAIDAILLTKTMKELDFNPPIVMAQNSGHIDSSFAETLGASMVEGISSRNAFSPDLMEKIPPLKKVNALFRERTKKAGKERDLSGASVRCFQGFMALAEALSRAKSLKPEDIRQAIIETDLKPEQLVVPWRGIKFGPDGQNMYGDAVVVQYQGGKMYTVWPSQFATRKIIYPIPKWSERK
ncbi:MAG: ABC transporter substrate-binding protein [Deltaproteobacteria bacterium]|nr:ABC transporter substrate-binding protein [Deltaproteobacteria bacterium]